jgi:hypothetical protein
MHKMPATVFSKKQKKMPATGKNQTGIDPTHWPDALVI